MSTNLILLLLKLLSNSLKYISINLLVFSGSPDDSSVQLRSIVDFLDTSFRWKHKPCLSEMYTEFHCFCTSKFGNPEASPLALWVFQCVTSLVSGGSPSMILSDFSCYAATRPENSLLPFSNNNPPQSLEDQTAATPPGIYFLRSHANSRSTVHDTVSQNIVTLRKDFETRRISVETLL